jgi:hypothetical protein
MERAYDVHRDAAIDVLEGALCGFVASEGVGVKAQRRAIVAVINAVAFAFVDPDGDLDDPEVERLYGAKRKALQDALALAFMNTVEPRPLCDTCKKGN